MTPLFRRRTPPPTKQPPKDTTLQAATDAHTAADATQADEWADPPAINLAAVNTIIDDGHTPLTDTQALARLGVRLSKGVAYMAPNHADVPLILHENSDHQAWAWLDAPLTQGQHKGALHVCLAPLLAGLDPATVNPLHPEGRRTHPTIPGGLAHAAAHLNHTRLNTTLLNTQPWPVRAAATILEEIRAEAAQVKDRPFDAVYLRASAMLWRLPEGEDRWRTAYLAATILGRRAAGILQPTDTTPAQPLIDAVFTRKEKNKLLGICGRAIRLPDGDTHTLIDLATQWVDVVGVTDPTKIFTDPCATRTHHMTPPTQGSGPGSNNSQNEDGGDGDGNKDSNKDSNASTGSTNPTGTPSQQGEAQGDQTNQADQAGQEHQEGQGQQADNHSKQQQQPGQQGTSSHNPQDTQAQAAPNPNPWGATPDLEWDDPAATALADVAKAATAGARDQLREQARSQAEREALIEAVTAPLDQATAEARQRREMADKTFAHSDNGNLVRPTSRMSRPPRPGEEKLARDLESALRKARFRERGKTKVAFDRPPGRLCGRDMLQRRAQASMGQMPTARPWRRQVYATTPTPTIYALILADKSGSMKWADKPVAAITWALSRAIHAVGGKAAALTFGSDVRVLADAGKPLAQVPVYSSGDPHEAFTDALKAGDGRLNLASVRGVRCLFVISDGVYSPQEREQGAAELTRLVREGVTVVWISPGALTGASRKLAAAWGMKDIHEWAPKGVRIVHVDSHTTAARSIVAAMAGTLITTTKEWQPDS